MSDFLTIRKTAATGLISQHYLRILVSQGRCPGIRVGNRFMVNLPQLRAMLEAQSALCGNEVRNNE